MSSVRRSAKSERSPSVTEYALVVLVMGMIGLVGVPKRQTVDASTSTREVIEDLSSLRRAIARYEDDHGRFPGADAGEVSSEVFALQLTKRTDAEGNVHLRGGEAAPLGPYLREIPDNVLTGLASVDVLEHDEPFASQPNRRTGWTYQPATGEIRANSAELLPGTRTRIYDL